MKRSKVLALTAISLWTVAVLTWAQGGPGGPNPNDPNPSPACLNCTYNAKLDKTQAIYSSPCASIGDGSTPYLHFSATCKRYVCDYDLHAYVWSGWFPDVCVADPETGIPGCPDSDCVILPWGMSGIPLAKTMTGGWPGGRAALSTGQAGSYNRQAMSGR